MNKASGVASIFPSVIFSGRAIACLLYTSYNGNPAVIVAVVDGGINQEHPDLQANLWTNPDEIPGNGMDDDGNGYVLSLIHILHRF